MTEFFLGLIPDYGLYLIFAVVSIGCIGIPLPSSVVLLTAGALAAAGDLTIWHVVLTAVMAYLVGDQIAFNIGGLAGPRLLSRLRSSSRFEPLVARSESLLEKHGLLGVFLSRTVFSPVGPFVGYVSGAVGTSWFRFSTVAAIAAMIWTLFYSMLGYAFAGELPQVSDLVASSLIVGIALLATIAFAMRVAILWKRFEAIQK